MIFVIHYLKEVAVKYILYMFLLFISLVGNSKEFIVGDYTEQEVFINGIYDSKMVYEIIDYDATKDRFRTGFSMIHPADTHDSAATEEWVTRHDLEREAFYKSADDCIKKGGTELVVIVDGIELNCCKRTWDGGNYAILSNDVLFNDLVEKSFKDGNNRILFKLTKIVFGH